MQKNTITVKAYLVSGEVNDVLVDATPKEAIEEYLFPDSGPPVQTLSIELCDDKGKQYSISIFPGGIVVRNVE